MRQAARFFLEGGNGRPRAAWRLLAQAAVFTAATTLFIGMLAGLWSAASTGAGPLGTPGGAPGGADPAVFLIGGLASLLAALLSAWLAGRFLDRRPFRDFGLRLDAGWWLDLVFGMLLGAALMGAVFLTELAFGWVYVVGTFEGGGPGTPFVAALAAPAATFVCIGVYEELISRGYQLRNIAEGLNHPALGPRGAILVAWLATSSFFGFLHLGNTNASLLSTSNIALAGLMLGLGYVLTGELAIPIGLHTSWNFFQGNVFGFPVSGIGPVGATFLSTEQRGPDLLTGGAFGPEAGLLGLLAILLGMLAILAWVRLRTGKVSIHAPLAEPPKHLKARKAVREPSHRPGA